MSRASEWAKRRGDEHPMAVTFRPNHPHQSGMAMVERNGDCFVELKHRGIAAIGASLAPPEALAFAAWIIDTFADKPTDKPTGTTTETPA